MQKTVLTVLMIMFLLNNSGCQTIESWGHYNGMTKEEIRNLWGNPSDVSKDGKFKYGADEIWTYSNEDPAKTGGRKIFYFYFNNGVVVNREAKWWEAL